MRIISRLAEHLDLMSQMFARTGAAEQFAQSAGENGLKQAIFQCAACKDTDECKQWLANAEQGAQSPEFCRNSQTIERLAAMR